MGEIVLPKSCTGRYRAGPRKPNDTTANLLKSVQQVLFVAFDNLDDLHCTVLTLCCRMGCSNGGRLKRLLRKDRDANFRTSNVLALWLVGAGGDSNWLRCDKDLFADVVDRLDPVILAQE